MPIGWRLETLLFGNLNSIELVSYLTSYLGARTFPWGSDDAAKILTTF